MTSEESLKLAQAQGELDFIIEWMIIQRRICMSLLKEYTDDYSKGLYRGTILMADSILANCTALSKTLESLMEERTNEQPESP